MSGTVSAIAAAREGVNVVLIEKHGFLGGTATACMLGEVNGFAVQGERIFGGITAEIVQKMLDEGVAEFHEGVPMSSDPSVLVDRVRYHSEYLKLVLDELVERAGVNVLYHSELDEVNFSSQPCFEIHVKNQFEKMRVEGLIAIDATGNAELAYKAGCDTYKVPGENLQSASLLFKMSGIAIPRYKTLTIENLREIILEGYEEGILPAKILSISPVPGTNDAVINATRSTSIDHESLEDVTRAESETRKQIKNLVPFLKRKIQGFEKSYLSAIAPHIGIRDSRRLVGKYVLTGSDIVNGKEFEDAVAVGGYPIDIHRTKNNSVEFKKIQGKGVYTIPFACLLPKEEKRLIVSGRCISVDNETFASIRVIPTVMAIGEAAGTAASMAVKRRIFPCEIDAVELQYILKSNGVKISSSL